MNVANAILILGAIYLHVVHGLDFGVTVALVLWGIGFWAYHGFTDERKKLLEAKIALLRAKTEYYERKGEPQ